MSFLNHYLRSPSAYRADPRGFALNQLGHALIVGLLPAALRLPIWIIIVAYSVWEVWQWQPYRAEPFDAFEDVTFVSVGALLLLEAWVGLVLFFSRFWLASCDGGMRSTWTSSKGIGCELKNDTQLDRRSFCFTARRRDLGFRGVHVDWGRAPTWLAR